MQRSASDEIANFIKNYHEKMGVEFKLGSRVQKYRQKTKQESFLMTDKFQTLILLLLA